MREKPVRSQPDLWVCDPKKNKTCTGKLSMHCGHECFCTTERKYAEDPSKPPLTNKEYNVLWKIRNGSTERKVIL